MFTKFKTPLSLDLLALGLIISTYAALTGHHVSVGASQDLPKLYLGSHIKSCLKDSPEIFYRNVAAASIHNLHEGRIVLT